jgi:hypothetical protein
MIAASNAKLKATTATTIRSTEAVRMTYMVALSAYTTSIGATPPAILNTTPTAASERR